MKRKINREDIVSAGLELMFRNGYNATGIKEITDHVKIPKGSFYNHFSNKEEFGLEVLQHYADNGTKLHRDALLNSKQPPIERMKQFYSSLIEAYASSMDYQLGCVMGNFSGELGDTNENFRKALDREFDSHESIIVRCLKEAKASGDIADDADVERLGAFILNSWHGALIRMKSTANKKPLDDFYSMTFGTLIV